MSGYRFPSTYYVTVLYVMAMSSLDKMCMYEKEISFCTDYRLVT